MLLGIFDVCYRFLIFMCIFCSTEDEHLEGGSDKCFQLKMWRTVPLVGDRDLREVAVALGMSSPYLRSVWHSKDTVTHSHSFQLFWVASLIIMEIFNVDLCPHFQEDSNALSYVVNGYSMYALWIFKVSLIEWVEPLVRFYSSAVVLCHIHCTMSYSLDSKYVLVSIIAPNIHVVQCHIL